VNMAKSNIRRIPFTLNLDDPEDAAIWEVLAPLLTRHRASQFIRGAIVQALGMGSRLPPALPAPQAKRSVQVVPQLPAGSEDSSTLERATDNFLNAFG
jgi:hypothetical protein